MRWPAPMPNWQYDPANVRYAAETIVVPVAANDGPETEPDRYAGIMRRYRLREALRRVRRGIR